MPMTQYLRKKLGDHSVGKAAFTMPTTVYLGLFSVNPTDAGSLTNEFTGGSYARQAITTPLSVFDLTTGIAALSSDVQFPAPTATWGTLTYIGVLDASTSGNMLYYEAVPSARQVVNGGRRVTFRAGQFQIRLI
jgi:hypothetical protein